MIPIIIVYSDYYVFFSFFLRTRVGKQRVESEVSIGDKVDKMEMDTVNYGYRPEALYTSHV